MDDEHQDLHAWDLQTIEIPQETAPPAQQQGLASQEDVGASTLEEMFATHVLRDFTPMPPDTLPMGQWVSCEQLLRQLQPHAPPEMGQMSPGYVKQLITEWYKDHPAFAGHPFTAWCKKLKDYNAQAAGRRSQIVKFSFLYTPTGEATVNPRYGST